MSVNQQPKSPIEKVSMQAFSKALVGIENAEVNPGTAIYTRGRIIGGESNRHISLIEHLFTLGVDVRKYGVIETLKTYAYSPEIPPNGLRGELIEIIRGKAETDRPNIVLTQPTQEGETKQ